MRVVAVVALILLAGCSGPPPPPSDAAPAADLLQRIDDRGLYELAELQGLRSMGEHDWEWDALAGASVDAHHVLLVQVLGPTNVILDVDVQVDGTGVGSADLGASGDACWTDELHMPVEGQVLIDRALGKATPFGAVPLSDGESRSSKSFGFGTSTGSKQIALGTGDWVLLAIGLTGLPPDEVAADGHALFTLRTTVPLRFVELRPSGFLCGSGFDRLGGQEAPAPVAAHVGGSGGIDALYGARFTFCAPAFDPRNTMPINSADVTFLGTTQRIIGPGYVGHNSTEAGRIELAVQQWAGQPLWIMEGLELPRLVALPEPLAGLCSLTP